MTEVFLVFPPVPDLFREQVQTGSQLILFPTCSGPYGVGPDGNRTAAPVEGSVDDLEEPVLFPIKRVLR